MRALFTSIIILAGWVGLIVGLIAMFKPIPRLRLNSRRDGLIAIVAGVVLFGVGAAFAPHYPAPMSGGAEAAAAAPEPRSSPAVAEPAASGSQIKPESVVEFPKGEVACLTKDALQQFILLALEGKQTKANALFDTGGDGPMCIMLPSGMPYKVIDAEYNDPDTPEAAILEVVGTSVTASANGAFVLIADNSMVKVVTPPKG